METPLSVRRNPPRKAKMVSACKTEPKPSTTGHALRLKVAKAKALLPSFEDSMPSSRSLKQPPPPPSRHSSRVPQKNVKHDLLKDAEPLLPTLVSSSSQMASEECKNRRVEGDFCSSSPSKLETVNVMQSSSSFVGQTMESLLTSSGSLEHHGNSSHMHRCIESSMMPCGTLKNSIQEGSSHAGDCVADSVIIDCVNPVIESVTVPSVSDDITESLATPLQMENPSANVSVEKENPSKSTPSSMKMHVYLRIRPARVNRVVKATKKTQKIGESLIGNRQSWKCPMPVDTKVSLNTTDVCLHHGSNSVMLVPPPLPSGFRRSKMEEFNGFSQIFGPDSSQDDVFSTILLPRLIDLNKGESSLVVAMGPTSAGKTYTMLGTPENPGLLPRSLQYLLEKSGGLIKIVISMFEIYSEQGGRSEKILDLLQDGAELNLQQHQIKGLHEAFVSTAEEASSIVLNGLQKRTTASTAANHCSSRSHCIINISTSEVKVSKDEQLPVYSKCATLTIADLAGFERERKTGNQGVRLIESSFINNTSMVFGQCLRALLEHQKNPKKPLQKHFQYSMLTRYLKPYMEAKGNMTLIVNVSPCEEDYLDTAFVLRQAAPYSAIKLNLIPPKETVDKPDSGKRPFLHQYGHYIKKRRKVDGSGIVDDKAAGSHVSQTSTEVEENNAVLNSDIQIVLEIETSEFESAENLDSDAIAYKRMRPIPILHEQVSEKLKLTCVAEVNKILIQNQVENSMEISQSIYEVFVKALEQHHDEVLGFKYRIDKRYKEIPLSAESLNLEQCNRSERPLMLGTSKEKQENFNLIISENKEELVRQYSDDGKSDGKAFEDAQTVSVSVEEHQNSYRGELQNDEKLVDCNGLSCQNSDGGMVMTNTCQDTETKIVLHSSLFKVDTEIKHESTHAGNDTKVFEDYTHLPKEFPVSKMGYLHSPDNLIPESGSNVMETNMSLDICSYKDIDCEVDIVKEEILNSNALQTGELLAVSEGIVSKASFQVIPKHTEGVAKEVEDPGFHSIYEAQLNEFPLQVSDSEDEFESDYRTMPIREEVQFKPVRKQTVSQVTLCNEECQVQKPVQEILTPLEKTLSSHVKGEKFGDQVIQMGTPLADSSNLADSEDLQRMDINEVELGSPEQTTEFNVHKELIKTSDGDSVSNLPTDAIDAPHPCLEEDRVSSFIKGRLLALSLIKEPDVSFGMRYDLNGCKSATSMATEAIGPIGLDLEKILEIPLLEIERKLWEPETYKCSRLSQLLANNGGILDINKFSRRFPKQRSFCLRYCLAVICGQMSVDGGWLPLLKEMNASRMKHFYAVIKAKTVSEAVGHARCGMQEELLCSNLPTKHMEGHKVEENVACDKAVKLSTVVSQAEDNKENKTAPSHAGKPVAPKRRKLQPMSSFCLQLGSNNIITDFESGDGIADEPCTAMLPRKANSLANLLMGCKK